MGVYRTQASYTYRPSPKNKQKTIHTTKPRDKHLCFRSTRAASMVFLATAGEDNSRTCQLGTFKTPNPKKQTFKICRTTDPPNPRRCVQLDAFESGSCRTRCALHRAPPPPERPDHRTTGRGPRKPQLHSPSPPPIRSQKLTRTDNSELRLVTPPPTPDGVRGRFWPGQGPQPRTQTPSTLPRPMAQ